MTRFVADLKRYPIFYLFMLAYTFVHLHFEYNFWVVGDAAVFAKYGSGDMLEVGEHVYYAKATWCFLLIWLLALRVRVKTAMAWAYLFYAVQLIAFFPIRIYAVLNVLLGLGMVIEVLIRGRDEEPEELSAASP